MNSKDIKLNHHYRLEIWENEPNFLQCTGLYDGWWEMSSFHMDDGMLIMNDDIEMTELTEISHAEYHQWQALWEAKYKHQHTHQHTPPEDPNPYAEYESLFENC